MSGTAAIEKRGIILRMVKRLVEVFSPHKIILFGSFARGTATSDSDADLLVVMPFRGPRRAARIKIRAALNGSGLAKDIFLIKPKELEQYRDLAGSLVYTALQEGRVLYAKTG